MNRSNSAGIKILNDDKMQSKTANTTTTQQLSSPTKHVSKMTIAKKKSSSGKQKQMEHYVMQTVKSESSNKTDKGTIIVEDDDDTIDFILADDGGNSELDDPSVEISEEFHLSGEDEDVVDGESEVKEMVEHVCGKCYKTFRRIKSLKKHLEFCRFDSGYHLRKAEMIKNLDKIEKDALIMENKDICFCCGESYDTFHLGHINCPDCPKSFKTQMSYERHIFITHSEFNDYPCSICNAKLRSAALQNLHEEQHRNRGKPYACKICGKDFTRSYHLKRHQKYSSCSANENDTMSCKVCDKVFYRLDNLRSHLKSHLGTQVAKKREYMCAICKNSFYSLSTLNIHIRTHTGERPFDCDLCDKKFPALVALKKHRRYHTGEKPYTCSMCNQSFAVKEVLNRHMKRHTGERPHKCDVCGKSFIQATQLRTHAKTHVRPFECDVCEEKFKTEKQLNRHSKTHSRAKRNKGFKCTTCKISFTNEQEYKEHMEKEEHNPRLSRGKAKRQERTDCAICEKNFDSADSLKAHIFKVHDVDPEELFGDKPPVKRMKVNADKDKATPTATNTTSEKLISTGTNVKGLVVREFLVEETIVLPNESYTVIPLESVDDINVESTESVKNGTSAPPPGQVKTPRSLEVKKEQRKSLAASLAAAIADNDDDEDAEENFEHLNEDDLKLKNNVTKLLDMLVDTATLKKFGWPETTEETVLCKVIENCGHDLSKDSKHYVGWDYATRMREYVKLLFTVVIHNDSIKELLNNYPIDDVIEYVLGNDDDDDDDDDDDGVGSVKDKQNVTDKKKTDVIA